MTFPSLPLKCRPQSTLLICLHMSHAIATHLRHLCPEVGRVYRRRCQKLTFCSPYFDSTDLGTSHFYFAKDII